MDGLKPYTSHSTKDSKQKAMVSYRPDAAGLSFTLCYHEQEIKPSAGPLVRSMSVD